LLHDPGVKVYETGRVVGAGSFICVECGFTVALAALEAIPECTSCGSTRFRRASLFEQPTADSATVEVETELGWLDDARARLGQQGRTGHFLAFEGDSGDAILPLAEGRSRIGRSVTAEIRLDDPTVSRRHAVIVLTPQRELRVLDDRSLNGVFVNGDQVEWRALHDGDELAIGRYRLYVLDTTGSPGSPAGTGNSYAVSG
jgi:DNA-directed RNA polymerase subunit RPC12/RpoP